MFGNKSKSSAQAVSQKPVAPVEPAPAPAPAAPAAARTNYLAAGTVIEGNIISNEELYIDGTVKGDIRTSSRLFLGKDSIVEGNITALDADVAGKITGTVESKGLLAIKATCRIEGDIITQSLNVESGSSFNGRCKVGGQPEKRPQEPLGENRVRKVVDESRLAAVKRS